MITCSIILSSSVSDCDTVLSFCTGLFVICLLVVVFLLQSNDIVSNRLIAAGKWDEMEDYADMIPKDTYDSSFFRAIINIHANEFQKAQQVGRAVINIHANEFQIAEQVGRFYWLYIVHVIHPCC